MSQKTDLVEMQLRFYVDDEGVNRIEVILTNSAGGALKVDTAIDTDVITVHFDDDHTAN